MLPGQPALGRQCGCFEPQGCGNWGQTGAATVPAGEILGPPESPSLPHSPPCPPGAGQQPGQVQEQREPAADPDQCHHHGRQRHRLHHPGVRAQRPSRPTTVAGPPQHGCRCQRTGCRSSVCLPSTSRRPGSGLMVPPKPGVLRGAAEGGPVIRSGIPLGCRPLRRGTRGLRLPLSVCGRPERRAEACHPITGLCPDKP